jgi:drug/metabolite transporter (DMT)-like permease
MNLSTFGFIISGVLLNAFAQLFLKKGTNAVGEIHLTAGNWLATGIKLATQWPILAGLACYAVSLVVWVIGLSRADVTMAYPMLSLGYIVTTILAWMFLGEVVSMQRMIALGVIVVGVALMART